MFDPAREPDALALIRTTPYDGVHLIPSSAALAPFDVSDQRAWERSDLHLSLIDPLLGLRPRYDYIFIDCPPRLSLVSFAGLCASDFVVVPLEAADWGAQGIVQVTEAVRYVQARYNPRLRLMGYLVSRYKQSRTYQQHYLRSLRERFGGLAFDTVIPDRADFEKSVTDRIPITRHAPGSAAAEIARRFFDELERRAQGDS